MKILVLVVFLLLPIPATAESASVEELRDEAERYVADPCMLYIVRSNKGFDDMDEDEALKLMKSVNKSSLEEVLQETVGLTKDLPDFKSRKQVYNFLKKQCISGAREVR